MPKLVSFGATEPEYAEECKDDVTPGSTSFDLDKMNEQGLALPEGNPCRNIAGAWVEQEPEVTERGVIYPDPESEGRSAWTTGGYDGSDGELGAGTTYDSVLACADREINRDLQAATYEKNHETWENSMEFGITMATGLCSVLPDATVAPMGFGVSFKIGDLCEGVLEKAQSWADFANDQLRINRGWKMTNKDNADCNSQQHGLARIFCDLHCIRDAVKAGDQSILKSLEDAVRVVGENTNLLVEYYSGRLQDSVDALKESMQADSSLVQIKHMKASLKSSFLEMRTMLRGRVSPTSKSSLVRAIDEFTARFSDPVASSNGSIANASNLLMQSEALHAVVSAASLEEGSATAQVAHQSAILMQQLHQTLKVRIHTLGVYQASSSRAKERQVRLLSRVPSLSNADVLNEVRVSAARVILLDLDKTWWDLRGKLDDYLEATQAQVDAYDAAFSHVDAYISKCSVGFQELKESYNRAMHAESSAHKLLRATWEDMSNSLGLLAAKIQDVDALRQLAVLDISNKGTLALEENRSVICSGPITEEQKILNALGNATAQGFMGQTWYQIHTLFRQVPLLHSRFLAGGLRVPDYQIITEAWSRMVSSYTQTMDSRSELAWEWFAAAKESRSCS